MPLNDLKPHQYNELYAEEDMPLVDVRKSILRQVLYAGIIVILTTLTLGAIVKIPIEQEYDFVLRAHQQEKIFIFPKPVYIEKIYVKAGQKIDKDAPLMEISSPEIADLIALYQQSRVELQTFLSHEIPMYNNQRKTLELLSKEQALRLSQAQQEKQHQQQLKEVELRQLRFNADEAERRHQINLKLFEKKAISEMELKDSEKEKVSSAALYSARAETFRQKIQQSSNEINKLSIAGQIQQQEIEKAELDHKRREQALRQAFELAQENLLRHYGNFDIQGNHLLIKAQQGGLVSYIFDGEKEVPASTICLRITEQQPELYAMTTSPPTKVGYLHKGSRVVLKVSTFPHYEWGVMHGYISHFSTTPDSKGNYPFEVSISDKGRIGHHLQIGMTGELSVITEERTCFELLFIQYSEWKENYLK